MSEFFTANFCRKEADPKQPLILLTNKPYGSILAPMSERHHQSVGVQRYNTTISVRAEDPSMNDAALADLRGHPVGRALICLLLFCFGASSADALPILSPTTYGEGGGGMSLLCGNTTVTELSGPGSASGTYTGPCAGSAGGGGQTIPGVDPVATATANSGDPNIWGQGGAGISGSFVVLGPTLTAVPVEIIASGNASAGGLDANALAQIIVTNGSDNAYDVVGTACASSGYCPQGSPSFTLDETTPAVTNVVNFVDLSASAGALEGSASAFIDPLIQIDPSFLAANPGFSLEFSPGFIPVCTTSCGGGGGGGGGGTTAVPEPATLPLLGLGLAAIGFARRRRAS